ncbi:MAG: acyltransferase [Lachnospiraceae bacterium]|nr:acyltransferase [Lachnospiraceae bacterium]
MDTQKNYSFINLTRSIAIACVVLCHATEAIYPFNIESMSTLNLTDQAYAFSLFTLGRLGVPLFLFITGFLLLDKVSDTVSGIKFWHKNFFNLLITTEIWIVIYHVFLCLYNCEPFYITKLIKEMLFVSKIDLGHFWYMPMILSLYLFIPIFSVLLKNMDYRLFIFPTVICILYLFGTPILNVLLICFHKKGIATVISLGFMGGVYGIYMLLGYFVKKDFFKKIPSKYCIVLAILCFMATVSLQLISYHNSIRYNVWYDCAFILICSFCIFEIITRHCNPNPYHIWQFFAKYAFSVYLIHYPLIMLLTPYINEIPSRPLRVWILFLTSFIGSLFIAYLINRLPKIGKWLLYLR